MTYRILQLSPDSDVRTHAAALLAAANLPRVATWTAAVSYVDLSMDKSPAVARQCDGMFTITAAGNEWLFDGGVNRDGVAIRWDIEVDLLGMLKATAFPTGKQTKGPAAEALMAALGCAPRVIGSVGALEELFPQGGRVHAVLQAIGIPELPIFLVKVGRGSVLRAQVMAEMEAT